MNRRITATITGLVLLLGPCAIAFMLMGVAQNTSSSSASYQTAEIVGVIFVAILLLTGGFLISESAVGRARIVGWILFTMLFGGIITEFLVEYFFGIALSGPSGAGIAIMMPSIFGYLFLSLYSLRCLQDGLASASTRCVECGYDLRGLSEPRCPECSTPFEPPEQRRNGDRVPDE